MAISQMTTQKEGGKLRVQPTSDHCFVYLTRTAHCRCFMLMVAISTLHNMSRSVGCALLALVDKSTLLLFLGVEVSLFMFRRFWLYDRHLIGYWPAIPLLIGSFLIGSIMKIVIDFTGCVHFRHPSSAGGAVFSASLLWSQIFPFVALFLLNKQDNQSLLSDSTLNSITFALSGSSIAWVLMNIVFFCTIDLAYLHTFFSTQTPQQFVISNFKNRDSDYGKFDAAFDNEIGLSRPIHGEIKQWIKENIQQWRDETPAWFKVELIPDEFLPVEIYEAEGGARRRRSSVGINSVREMIGLGARAEMSSTKVHPGGVGLGQNEGQETS